MILNGQKRLALHAAVSILKPKTFSIGADEWEEDTEIKQMAAEFKPNSTIPEHYFLKAWAEMGQALLQSGRDAGWIR